jgi:hypothetical protein
MRGNSLAALLIWVRSAVPCAGSTVIRKNRPDRHAGHRHPWTTRDTMTGGQHVEHLFGLLVQVRPDVESGGDLGARPGPGAGHRRSPEKPSSVSPAASSAGVG